MWEGVSGELSAVLQVMMHNDDCGYDDTEDDDD